MTEWRCLVVSNEGRSDWRLINAADRQNVVSKLVAEGLTPLEIRSGATSLLERLNQPIRLRGGLSVADQALVMTQLATLMRAGLPIDRSLDLLREQARNARVRALLASVIAHVRSGGTLATALDQMNSFPAYVVGVIRAAERTGHMNEALASLASRLTLAASTRRQLMTALTYPAAVLGATLLALALVLTMVVPQFEPIFAGQEDKLPALTKAVLGMSNAVSDHGFVLLSGVGIAPMFLWLLLRSSAGIVFLNRYRVRIPGLGMYDQYVAGQFIGIFATLIGAGVAVIDALPLARDAIGSQRWRKYVQKVEHAIRAGSRLSAALSRDALIPNAAVRLIEVGEHSGQLAQTCREASTIISENVRARIDRVVALVNPVAIIVLGGLAGLLVAGVMLGIFALGDFAG